MGFGRRAALAILLALSVLAAGGARVSAHALLIASSPAANAVLATAPTSATLTFTEPPDPHLSSVRVLDASGTGHTTGPAVTGADATTLTVPLGPLQDGVYTVAWRTVSATDGHATAGSFAFSVGTAAPSPAPVPGASAIPGAGTGSPADTEGASTVSAASVLARMFMYLGLIVLLGTLVIGEALLGGGSRRLHRAKAVAWLLAVVGAVALFAAQTSDAGVSLGDAVGSTLGADNAGRLVPLVLGGLALFAARGAARRPAAITAIGLVAVALLVDAAASHASSVLAPPLNIALQWLHAVGVAIWLGGLGALLLELRGRAPTERAPLVAAFSRWATIGIVVVGLTGVARAAFELHSLSELTSTDYGRLLVVKLAFFAGLALLGAVNHFRNVPGGESRVGAVQRAGSLELLIGASALVVASLLVTTPPPADLVLGGTTGGSTAATPTAVAPATPSASPVVVGGADYATTVNVQLTVSPGTPGPSTFVAVVTDYDTGKPITATGLKLRFALPSRPDVGASSLALTAGADGTFTGEGSNLSLTGIWTVTAVVTEASTSIEVPLAVPVAQASGPVDVNRVSGQPTLYTVHLPSGNEAQLYLDTLASSGPLTLHITYFDPAGKERAVTGIKAEAAWPGANPSPLLMSPIEPGHATAKLQPPEGLPILVLVTGAGPDGAAISFSLTLAPGG